MRRNLGLDREEFQDFDAVHACSGWVADVRDAGGPLEPLAGPGQPGW